MYGKTISLTAVSKNDSCAVKDLELKNLELQPKNRKGKQ